MDLTLGRLARALLLVGGLAALLALPGIVASPSSTANDARVVFAAPAQGNDNNDDRTNDNAEERILRGQVLELWDDRKPPEILVATARENVWARLYNDQLKRSGVRVGDHVRLQGEYGGTVKGVFDAYEVDVQSRCCPSPNNDNND